VSLCIIYYGCYYNFLFFILSQNILCFLNKFQKLLDTINNINHILMTKHEKQIKILITWKCIRNTIYFYCYFYFSIMRYLAIINYPKVIIKWYPNGHFNASPRIIYISSNDMKQKFSRWPSSGLDLKIIVGRYRYR